MRGRVLVLADGCDTTRHLAVELQSRGHEVDVAASADALDRSLVGRPDLLVLDAGAHSADVVRRLRADPMTAWLPVVVLTPEAAPSARALLLASGADDCLSTPCDPLELVARVEGTLRRTADIRALSPLTGLPGNHRIEVEVATRAATGHPYAVCHVDLDEFKAFNDAYGFARGDGLLLLLARCLQQAAAEAGEPPAFIGHVGGDDFVVVCLPDQAEPLCASALEAFRRGSADLYDPADLVHGYLETVDRRGVLRRQPLVSVSVGVAHHRGGPGDHRRVLAAANEMKGVAKAEAGSHVAVDRRG